MNKPAAYIPVSRELLGDTPDLSALVTAALDRRVRPWRYPDRNPMPTFVPFPRLDRFTRWLTRAHKETL